jgi:hypothetical protein
MSAMSATSAAIKSTAMMRTATIALTPALSRPTGEGVFGGRDALARVRADRQVSPTF